MKVVAVIQARMGSKRLPKKTLMQISGKTLLNIVIESVKKNRFIDQIIVATTNLSEDDLIEKECDTLGITCQRGDAKNVLSRYINVAKKLQLEDHIVRVTADNPLNNSDATQSLFSNHVDENLDYSCIKGLSHTVYELVKVGALLKLESNHNLSESDKEHVTKYIRENPDQFKNQFVSPKELGINSRLDELLTVDTREDYERFLRISQQFNILEDINFNRLNKFLKQNLSA